LKARKVDSVLIRRAWEGRVSGCMLGKPLEILSFRQGRAGIESYLKAAQAWPLRDYVPLIKGSVVERTGKASCLGQLVRAEPDDDINYTVLALLLLEDNGIDFKTEDVARAWLGLLPAGTTWTAERAAYKTLLCNMDDEFVNGAGAGFDLTICSDNEYNQWIGAQIRADLYGWVCPGRPELAAELARRDASLSHRGEGLNGAMFIAALGAAIPATDSLDEAIDIALEYIPSQSEAAAAVQLGRKSARQPGDPIAIYQTFEDLSPVHTLNNLAVVIWALCSSHGDFSVAIGNAVGAGWDTDCNGATVGGLFGLTGAPIPNRWTSAWNGRIAVSLAGYSELSLEELVIRTVSVGRKMNERLAA
jgi:ADP-ribosylglycohydrolase